MPVLTTYPGVYIEEIPSGVHTITGVATSIAAFIGWASKGANDRAVLILSFADFEREFGGLDSRSLLGYAVFHFFLNGGQRCYVIRLVANNAATATLTLNDLFVKAKSPGDWANDHSIRIKARPAPDNARFGLAVVFKAGTPQEVVAESFENLSMSSSDGRFVGSVVSQGSLIVNASVTGATQPADGDNPLTGGVLGDVLGPNDGADFEAALVPGNGSGIDLLDHVDLFNILCIPGETNENALQAIQKYCRDNRAMLLVDCPVDATLTSLQNGPPTTLTGADGINAGFYFPWLKAADPLLGNLPRTFPPCGFIAGIYARIDATRGVWKAPAGTEASVTGASAVAVPLTDNQNGVLNPQAINCIRNFPCSASSLGARARLTATTSKHPNGNTFRSGGWHCFSKKACIAALNGPCLSRTTSRSGRKFGSTLAPSCKISFARGRSKVIRRRKLTSLNATVTPQPKAILITASSTSWSVLRLSNLRNL